MKHKKDQPKDEILTILIARTEKEMKNELKSIKFLYSKAVKKQKELARLEADLRIRNATFHKLESQRDKMMKDLQEIIDNEENTKN